MNYSYDIELRVKAAFAALEVSTKSTRPTGLKAFNYGDAPFYLGWPSALSAIINQWSDSGLPPKVYTPRLIKAGNDLLDWVGTLTETEREIFWSQGGVTKQQRKTYHTKLIKQAAQILRRV